MTVEPIGSEQRHCVQQATQHFIALANELLDTRFTEIAVQFDLRGRAAGMYRVLRGKRSIRYNPYLFAKYYDENLHTTVPHEVAHYVTDSVYGYANVKPHGHEWRTVMRMFSADPSVHCNFDLTGIPVKQYRRIRYTCRCRFHELTRIRHNRIQTKGKRYFCQLCRSELVLAREH